MSSPSSPYYRAHASMGVHVRYTLNCITTLAIPDNHRAYPPNILSQCFSLFGMRGLGKSPPPAINWPAGCSVATVSPRGQNVAGIS